MGDDRKYRLHSVVPPGMPVTEFIRQAERAYQALLSGQVSQASRLFPPEIVTDLVELIRADINPKTMPEVHPDLAGLEDRKRACAFFESGLWPAIRDRLLQVSGSRRMVAVFDADGVALELDGHREMLRETASFRLVRGVRWVGRQPATNAVRMARLTGGPSQLVGPCHLKLAQQQVGCTTVPVVGPNGCAGYIDLVSPAREINPDMMALVNNVAQDISVKIKDRYRAKLGPLRQWAQAHLDTQRYTGGALVIDKTGWVAWAWRQDHEDRVQAPEGGFRIGCREVDGLGRIVLEPAPRGSWLIRRRIPDEGTPAVRLALDLRISSQDKDRAGRIRVSGPTVSWEEVLSTADAEILLVLAELGGRTYDELERDLYTRPPASRSTIRSRWCRLREILGNILACTDGRHTFAPNVIMAGVRYPLDRTDLLPGSAAPRIERLREPL
jgi:hypothetical protein